MKKCWWVILTVLVALSCSRESYDGNLVVGEPTKDPVSLAVGVGNFSVVTKGNPSILTEMDETNYVGKFRGTDYVAILPYNKTSALDPANDLERGSLSGPERLPSFNALFGNSGSHLYSMGTVNVPQGTGAVLAYARATQQNASFTPAYGHIYGALDPQGFSYTDRSVAPGEVGFNAVPIYSGNDMPQSGRDIAQIMTDIVLQGTFTGAGVYYITENQPTSINYTVNWNAQTEDADLREWYNWFTNKSQAFAGSGKNAEYMISLLYQLLKDYTCTDTTPISHQIGNQTFPVYLEEDGTTPMTVAFLFEHLSGKICDFIQDHQNLSVQEDDAVQFVENNLRDYPETLGLPDGAAAIRWDGLQFSAVADQLDGMAPISSYCYPPEMWYFSNTTVRTSLDDLSSSYEVTEENQQKSWLTMLSLYTDGPTVRKNTRSVALVEPLHYSCGMLRATLHSNSSSLDDGDGKDNTVFSAVEENFQLTGIILSGQKNLRFDFVPKTDGPEYFLYDNQFSGIYLRKTKSDYFRTFVSQTPENEDIFFCLEFRNNCGSAFVGAEGNIMPGSKFYLVGKLEKPSEEDRNNGLTSVFMKDFITDVGCVVYTLSEAHNAIPDMDNPRLALGVRTQINWIQTTPATLVMY